ncbi:MAG: FAD-binding oxidoreductase [Nitrososphaerota archaeon]|nr:FAD-binding oxidoreductase [Candidatus Bathyarchaeota archaeon]MDW8023758.1 FAD-binding oxidoreductase [Nitrososphaerota archaeon]
MVIEELKASGCEVSSEPAILKKYSCDFCIWAEPSKPTCVVWARNTEGVQRVVKIANKYNEPIIPVSSGIHFYGATIPDSGGIIVDLSKLNKFVVDRRNKCVAIEPGVRWGPLQEELKKYGLRVPNPLLPHPESSVLTSILEREPPLIWKFEYKEQICSLEIVLPNGELFRTGSASVTKPSFIKVDKVVPYGPGLNWHWLFQGAQGTLGIVTWMNIRAEILPSLQKVLFVPSSDIEDIVEIIYKIGMLMVGYECFILNDLNLALILEDSLKDLQSFRKQLPRWVLILNLGAMRRFPEEKIMYEEEALRDLGVDFAPTLCGSLDWASRLSELLSKPWETEPYWKFRYKGGCQSIFFISSLSSVKKYLYLLFDLAAYYGYSVENIGVYVQPLEYGRAAYCDFSFHYDPDDPEKVKLKQLISNACMLLAKNGAFFNRPYGPMAEAAYGMNASYSYLLRKVKDIFDVQGIMNPGKLCFR